jgi:hypothetical protein
MSDYEPRFEAKPSGPLGDGWNVHVFWAADKVDRVISFPTQYDALDWIKHKSANWLADYILRESRF